MILNLNIWNNTEQRSTALWPHNVWEVVWMVNRNCVTDAKYRINAVEEYECEQFKSDKNVK